MCGTSSPLKRFILRCFNECEVYDPYLFNLGDAGPTHRRSHTCVEIFHDKILVHEQNILCKILDPIYLKFAHIIIVYGTTFLQNNQLVKQVGKKTFTSENFFFTKASLIVTIFCFDIFKISVEYKERFGKNKQLRFNCVQLVCFWNRLCRKKFISLLYSCEL